MLTLRTSRRNRNLLPRKKKTGKPSLTLIYECVKSAISFRNANAIVCASLPVRVCVRESAKQPRRPFITLLRIKKLSVTFPDYNSYRKDFPSGYIMFLLFVQYSHYNSAMSAISISIPSAALPFFDLASLLNFIRIRDLICLCDKNVTVSLTRRYFRYLFHLVSTINTFVLININMQQIREVM